MPNFTERLTDLQSKQNHLKKDIESAVNTSVMGYYRYEKGERELSMSTLIDLADYFGVSIDYPVGRTDNPELISNLVIVKPLYIFNQSNIRIGCEHRRQSSRIRREVIMKNKVYDITICILCIASVWLAIIDFTQGLTSLQKYIDDIIYVVFVIDYIVRFIIAKDKKSFFKANILDLIAIIPLNSALRIFRTLKFSRLLKFAKLLKLFRIGSVSARMLSKTKRFLNTNGLKYVLMLSVASILCATIGIIYFEHMNFTDALWWAFVTTTTVGYGDLSPSTNEGRIIASLLMLIGIGMIGSLTSSITSFFLRTSEEPKKFSSDKVEMVMTMYMSLSDEEKQEVLHQLIH